MVFFDSKHDMKDKDQVNQNIRTNHVIRELMQPKKKQMKKRKKAYTNKTAKPTVTEHFLHTCSFVSSILSRCGEFYQQIQQ